MGPRESSQEHAVPAALHRCNRPMALLIPLLMLACGGCGSDTIVELECPSPDRSLVAVVFSRSGGGAAGWSSYAIALQAGDAPRTLPNVFGRQSLTLLTVESIDKVSLEWKSDDDLSVFGMPTISRIVREYPSWPIRGQRPVRISFTDRGRMGDGDLSCFSGGRQITRPPTRRIPLT